MDPRSIQQAIESSLDYETIDLRDTNLYEDKEFRIVKVFDTEEISDVEITAGVIVMTNSRGKLATESFFNDSTSCDFPESRMIHINMYNSKINPEEFASTTKEAREWAENKMIEIRDAVHEVLTQFD